MYVKPSIDADEAQDEPGQRTAGIVPITIAIAGGEVSGP
jgi:hypothetical protein